MPRKPPLPAYKIVYRDPAHSGTVKVKFEGIDTTVRIIYYNQYGYRYHKAWVQGKEIATAATWRGIVKATYKALKGIIQSRLAVGPDMDIPNET